MEGKELSQFVVEPGALEAINRAEVDVQISTAKTYPRDLKSVMSEMETMATLDQKTAEGCFYTLKRKGRDGTKLIEGPSVRLAEIAISSWGNLRCQARVIEENRKFVKAQAVTWDLEKNVAVSVESQRRITDRNGNRYSDDMVMVTANAAISIALRNSVFRVIPKNFIDQIYDKARKTAFGDAKSIIQRRQAAIDTFGKMGVEPEQILSVLEKTSVEDVGAEDLSKLLGLLNAIKDGSQSIDDIFFDTTPPTQNGKSRAQEVLDKVKS